jgi:hypothetical protein
MLRVIVVHVLQNEAQYNNPGVEQIDQSALRVTWSSSLSDRALSQLLLKHSDHALH